ncbi:MAG: protein phosphatase CheZ [Thiohalomonadaceae bacterium]
MSNDLSVLHEDYVSRAREMLRHMKQGDEAETARLLDEIVHLREDSLFRELGRLTRDFHDSLNNFRLDSRLADIAQNEIPDARDRLSYVISMTEQAANRTLNAIEDSLPACEALESRVSQLREQWACFTRREMDAPAFRNLSRDLEAFLGEAGDDLQRLRANLQDVLMAQGFQDLTGQIIRRVITLVEELERNLVELVRISGQKLAQPAKEARQVSAADVHGPAIPGLDTGTVSGQDEVDDLLSSLGF